MADEILNSGLGDGRTTEVLGGMIELKLADRANFMNHGAIINMGDQNGRGSDTEKVYIVGLDGSDEMAATGGEATSVSNTAFTDASATVAVARQALAYEMSDLAMSIDSTGITNPERFATSMAASAGMRLCSMFAALGAGFANTAGRTGENMTHDDFMDAIFTLQLYSVAPPYLCLLHPQQFGDWQRDLRGESGVVQWQAATQEMQILRGQGFKGNFNGVDVVTSTKVPTSNAGADRGGCMFGRGAAGYKTMTVARSPGKIAAGGIFAGPVYIGFSRNERTALELTVGNLYAGVVEIQDLAGVEISTDA